MPSRTLVVRFRDLPWRLSVTSMPWSGGTATIFMAESMVSQLRSFILSQRFSRTACARLRRLVAAGVFDPLSSLAAFLMKYDTAGSSAQEKSDPQ